MRNKKANSFQEAELKKFNPIPMVVEGFAGLFINGLIDYNMLPCELGFIIVDRNFKTVKICLSKNEQVVITTN